MPRQIPRPDEPKALSPQQPLVAGIPLERGRTWGTILRFAALFFPVAWLLLWLTLLLWRPTTMALLDGLAWSLPLTLVGTALFYFTAPWLAPPRRLLLRNQVLQIEERSKVRWEHPIDEPFCAALLYRDHREDGLLIVQPEEGPACFLYGRYDSEYTRPPRAIPVSPLGFSLAEEALDRFGAYMMPDRRAQHLPPLAQAMADAPGFAQAPLRLPLAHPEPPLYLGQHLLSWHTPDGLRASLSYRLTSIHPFRITDEEDTTHNQLLFCLERDPHATTPEMDASPDKPFPPFWIAVEWPRSLPISHLPHATPLQRQEATLFSPIDTVILLDQLARRGVIHAPFALLQSNTDTIPDTP